MRKPSWFHELAGLAAAETPAEAIAAAERDERARQRQQREERLADSAFFSGPAVTAEDKAAVIHGTLRRDVHALAVVISWQERFQGKRPGAHVPIVVLLGPTGRGKTVAGAWLIAEEGGKYVSALELAKRLCTRHWRDANWTAEILSSRVVVLDDVGTEPESDRELATAAMFEFVNKRQALARALTLITANLTRPEFDARYGERTVKRILHVGRFVEVKGPDLRRRP